MAYNVLSGTLSLYTTTALLQTGSAPVDQLCTDLLCFQPTLCVVFLPCFFNL